MHSKRQTLIIVLLSVLLFAALIINFILAWFYSSSAESQLNITGGNLDYVILNSATLDFQKSEIYAGNTLSRTIRFINPVGGNSYYARVETIFRINGIRTTQITSRIQNTSIMDPIDRNFLEDKRADTRYFYCESVINAEEWCSPVMYFEINEDLRSDFVNGKLTVEINFELREESLGVIGWDEYLPDNFPV